MADHLPVELSPPDIAPWRAGNTGVDYVHVLDSGRPGSTVMVQALTHGNEFCGAIALDWLLREGFRPARGRLLAAFANVEAYARFDFDDPDASRYVDEDYNRVQPGLGRRSPVRQARLDRVAPGAAAAALRRRRRLSSRPALDARALPADHGLRHRREERRFRA